MTEQNWNYSTPAEGAATTAPGSQNRPSITSGRAGRGEAPALPVAICTATRHDISRAAYQAGCRCPGAVEKNRAYYRDYNRRGREHDAWRRKQNEYARRYQEQKRADPRGHAKILADKRRWRAERRRLERDELRRYVDIVAVERAVDGGDVRLNRAEKIEALRRLVTRGLSVSAAAQQLGINGRYARKYADLIEQGDVA